MGKIIKGKGENQKRLNNIHLHTHSAINPTSVDKGIYFDVVDLILGDDEHVTKNPMTKS